MTSSDMNDKYSCYQRHSHIGFISDFASKGQHKAKLPLLMPRSVSMTPLILNV
jgi:hypothetical protein